MQQVDLSHDTQHVQRLVSSLATAGWRATRVPVRGRLAPNRQLLILGTPQREVRLRLSVYKVGGTGRDRPDERRVEITTTYHAGMTRLADYQDVTLGSRSVKGMTSARSKRTGQIGTLRLRQRSGRAWSSRCPITNGRLLGRLGADTSSTALQPSVHPLQFGCYVIPLRLRAGAAFRERRRAGALR
jgi:hypothetical protein